MTSFLSFRTLFFVFSFLGSYSSFGYVVWGTGAAQIGQGGAVSDTEYLGYVNPGAASFGENGLNLTPAYSYYGGVSRSQENSLSGIQFSASMPFFSFFKSVEPHVHVVGYVPFGSILKFESMPNDLLMERLYRHRRPELHVSGSFKAGQFGIGGGASIFAYAQSDIELDVLVQTQKLVPKSKTHITLDFSPYGGLFYRPTSWIQLNVNIYGPEKWGMRVNGLTQIHVFKNGALKVPLDGDGLFHFVPMRIQLVVTLQFIKSLRVITQVDFEQWSRFQAYFRFKAAGIEGRNRKDSKTRDIWIPRLAFEWHMVGWLTMHFGGAYVASQFLAPVDAVVNRWILAHASQVTLNNWVNFPLKVGIFGQIHLISKPELNDGDTRVAYLFGSQLSLNF